VIPQAELSHIEADRFGGKWVEVIRQTYVINDLSISLGLQCSFLALCWPWSHP